MVADVASRVDLKPSTPISALRVEHVRFESARAMKTIPSTVLKFDLFIVSGTGV